MNGRIESWLRFVVVIACGALYNLTMETIKNLHRWGVLLLMCMSVSAASTTVLLQWDKATNDPEWIVTSYEVNIFTNAPTDVSSNWIAYIKVGDTNQCTWEIQQVGVKYWATVRAFDSNNIASDYSVSVGFMKPAKPTLKISPKLQLSAKVDGPWIDGIKLDPLNVEMVGDAEFWRMKMEVEPVELCID